MVKSHEKKCQNYFHVTTNITNDMMKCSRSQQEKMMDFDYYEEYLKGIYQTIYCYCNVKKSTFSFSSDLQIGKKINNVKEDPRRKIDSNFNFSKALRCLVFIRFYLIRRNIT